MNVKHPLLISLKQISPIVFLSIIIVSCGGGKDNADNGVVNHAPISISAEFSLPPGDTYTGTLIANDLDADELAYSIVTPPTNGTLTLTDTTTGAFTYTLNSSEIADSFTFWVNDGLLDSNIATVTITGTIASEPTSGLQAVSGDLRVTVNWDLVSGAESYNVYWSETADSGKGGTLVSGVNPPFYHDGVTNGLNYNYVVTSVNAVGESAASTEVSATPADIFISSLSFADANLAACVDSVATLSGLSYVHELTNLNCYNKGIVELDGIEVLSKLTILNLASNTISNVAALSALTDLELLYLHVNSIIDVTPLSGLVSLTDLRISSNAINDVMPLSNLTKLTLLYLNQNNISDISALSGLTELTRLTLNYNNISELIALSSLTNLTYLRLDGNNISDVNALSSLVNLTELLMQSTNTSDVSGLSGLTKLTKLYLTFNNIVDVSPLSGLTNLTELGLYSTSIGGQGIGNIDSLVNLVNLNRINLGWNHNMSCAELDTLISVLGSPPVDADNDVTTTDIPINGTNCKNP